MEWEWICVGEIAESGESETVVSMHCLKKSEMKLR